MSVFFLVFEGTDGSTDFVVVLEEDVDAMGGEEAGGAGDEDEAFGVGFHGYEINFMS